MQTLDKPKRVLSPEHKAKLAAGKARAKAEREAAGSVAAIIDEVAPTAPVKVAGLKNLHLRSRPKELAAFRSLKIVMPECQVAETTKEGSLEYTTGPCQQALAEDPTDTYTWHLRCDHGPTQDADGHPIPVNERPYWEQNIFIEKTPVVEQGVIISYNEVPRYKISLRLREIALSDHVGGIENAQKVLSKGGKDPKEFGIAPFCEYYGCFRQDGLSQFKNGIFCSRRHAALIYIREKGIVMPIEGFDLPGRPVNQQKRADLLNGRDPQQRVDV
jgi:hypothetical protein